MIPQKWNLKEDKMGSAIHCNGNWCCDFGCHEIYLDDQNNKGNFSSFAHLEINGAYGDADDPDIFAGEGEWNWLSVKEYELWKLTL